MNSVEDHPMFNQVCTTSDPHAIECGINKEFRVVVSRTRNPGGYPEKFPWNPPEIYPELPDFIPYVENRSNFVYAALRRLLYRLELDSGNFGTSEWNPLGAIIKPGDNVLIKPCMEGSCPGDDGDIYGMTTDVSLIRAVSDYVLLALKGKGSVTIGDSPPQETDFSVLKDKSRIGELISYINTHSPVKLQLVDFRNERCFKDGGNYTHFA